MRLNIDCIRDILLAVENLPFGEHFTMDRLQKVLPAYTEEELWYTSIKLNEGGYLDIMSVPMLRSPLPGIKSINDLTFEGHEFLNNIRDDSNWGKVKEVAKKAGSSSLNALGQIATSVISSAIASLLQPH